MQAAVSIAPFLDKLAELIINPLIYLAFTVALFIFITGIIQFIRSETSDAKRGQGKQKIVWGLVGMFIMFSAYGIVRLIIASVPGLKSDTGYINFQK